MKHSIINASLFAEELKSQFTHTKSKKVYLVNNSSFILAIKKRLKAAFLCKSLFGFYSDFASEAGRGAATVSAVTASAAPVLGTSRFFLR